MPSKPAAARVAAGLERRSDGRLDSSSAWARPADDAPGFGQTRPLDRAGHDANDLALSGFASYSGRSQAGPVLSGMAAGNGQEFRQAGSPIIRST
ncbi:MAG: hypothetical protein AAGE01_08190 [Pseudomonadota bacterium]